MLTIRMDTEIDAVSVEFEHGKAGYAVELDPDRIVDFSSNPGHEIGVSLHNVSKGVKLEGLPQADRLRSIFSGLGIKTIE